jgi:hypothetical protein
LRFHDGFGGDTFCFYEGVDGFDFGDGDRREFGLDPGGDAGECWVREVGRGHFEGGSECQC